MITRSTNFASRLRNRAVANPMVKRAASFLQRIGAEEAGITALETAIILIAFVVVASVFAFTMLSAGTFSTERGKETIYAGLQEVQSSMEIKGGVIAKATPSTASTTGTVDSLIFTLSNVLGGQAINLNDGDDAVLVFEYRDANQRVAITSTVDSGWEVNWLGNFDDDGLLEAGELAEITVPLDTLNPTLGPNTTFVLEIKPPSGAILNLQRTTPAWLETINDLQ